MENLPSKQPGSDATAYLTCYLRLLPDVDMKNSSTVDGVCANSSKVDCARAYIPTHDLDKATRQELESYRKILMVQNLITLHHSQIQVVMENVGISKCKGNKAFTIKR